MVPVNLSKVLILLFVLEVEGSKKQLSSALLLIGAHQWLSEATHRANTRTTRKFSGNFHFVLTTGEKHLDYPAFLQPGKQLHCVSICFCIWSMKNILERFAVPKGEEIIMSIKYLYCTIYILMSPIFTTKSHIKALLLLIQFVIENKTSFYILYNSYCSIMQTYGSDCSFTSRKICLFSH